jgi:predicted amidohydrolase YtcJ
VILENGVIRTMDPSLPSARALAIAGERIAGGVGTHEVALPTPDRVDLRGRCVVPGFNDAHVHFFSFALASRRLRLEACSTLAQAVGRVRQAIESTRHPDPTRWLLGSGWQESDWHPAALPTRQDLDPVSAGVPVALWSKDGHSLWLNSAALAHAGGDLSTPGGVVEVDDQGVPTGVLREQSAWQFNDRYLEPSEEDDLEAVRAAVKLANARGVTAIHDMERSPRALRAWQRLRNEAAPTIRVWHSLPFERLPALASLGLRSGLGDDFVRLGHLKVFMDGALGSQTAWMLSGPGVAITTGPQLADMIREASAAGWPIAVHAIGDRANREALDAFEATRASWHPSAPPRIEHAQLVDPADLTRFAVLGVACSVQFSHAPADRDLAERRWPDKAGAYAYRSLAASGALLANGSDAPIEELDPLAGIRAGVLRTLDARPGWRMEEAVTVDEALRATTVNPARLTGDGHRRGKLLPGYLADLVVLDRDPLAVTPQELPETRVVATMVAGRWVHNPPPWD